MEHKSVLLCVLLWTVVTCRCTQDNSVLRKRETPVFTCASDGTGNVAAVPAIVQSPNYPSDYDFNTECSHDIVLSQNKVVVVQFDFYDIGDNDPNTDPLMCYDKLKLQDDVFPLLLTTEDSDMCVQIDDPGLYMQFTFYSNSASIQLSTDELVNRPGYHATVTERDAILFPFGPYSTDVAIPLTPDSGSVMSTDSFTYFGTSYSKIVINEDGVLTFDPLSEFVGTEGFGKGHLEPLNTYQQPMVSVYQADHSLFFGDSGTYFRTITSSSEASVMADINEVVNSAFPCRISSFVGTSATVITYWRNRFLGADKDGLRLPNTYQIVIVTRSGGETYAIINYHEVQWYSATRDSNGNAATGRDGIPARAGFTDGKGNAYENPLSGTVDVIDMDDHSNVGVKGRYVYRIDGAATIEHPMPSILPTITCPPHIIAVDCGSGAYVIWSDPQTESDCGPITDGPTCSESPGVFTQSTTVTCTVSNRSGTSSCSFQITVTPDTDPPTIGPCPQDITAEASSDDGEIITYTTPLGSDDCTHDVTCQPASGSLFPCDTTQVVCTAIDQNGASASCSFNVLVNCAPEDSEPPVITNCPADISLIDSGNNGEQVSWTEPEATDNSGNVYLTSTHQPGETFTEGTTYVIYTASDDAGNQAMCSFKVTVVLDSTPPVLTGCPSDIEQNERFEPGEIVNWVPPVATDNSQGPVVLSSTHDPGDTFHIGEIKVTYTATDEAGHQDTCSFFVTIVEVPGQLGICRRYFVHRGLETYSGANTSCALAENELAPVPTSNVNSALVQLIQDQGFGSYSFWFGVSKFNSSSDWKNGNKSLCYENWLDPSEKTDSGQECAQLWSPTSPLWTSEDCTDKKGYICRSLP